MSKFNPDLMSGPLQSQHTVLAIIVDNGSSGKGPKDGSCLVRILGEHDNLAQQQDQGGLQWVKVEVPGKAQSRTVGSFPGHQYQVGTKVRMTNMGPQGWIINGAMANNLEDDQRRDVHHGATENSHTPWSDFGSPSFRGPPQRRIRGQPYQDIDPDSITGLGITNGIIPSTPPPPEDGVYSALNKTPTNDQYKRRIKPRLADKECKAGNECFDGNENATEFMKNVGAEEVVKNAQNMIEQLKKTAAGGLNIPMADSVGGMGNILGAIASVASMLAAIKQGTKEDDKKTLKDHLRSLYKTMTGKEPLDIYGNETLEYQKWEAEQMKGMGLDPKTGEPLTS